MHVRIKLVRPIKFIGNEEEQITIRLNNAHKDHSFVIGTAINADDPKDKDLIAIPIHMIEYMFQVK